VGSKKHYLSEMERLSQKEEEDIGTSVSGKWGREEIGPERASKPARQGGALEETLGKRKNPKLNAHSWRSFNVQRSQQRDKGLRKPRGLGGVPYVGMQQKPGRSVKRL